MKNSTLFQQLPKVELHVHLDCSLSFDFVQTYLPELSFSEFQEQFIGPKQFSDLAAFLTYANFQIDLLQTEQQLRHAVRDVIKQLKLDQVIYAEIRFAPHLHCQKGLTAFEVVQIVTSEADMISKKWGINVKFLLCTLRHFNQKQSFEVVEMVDHFLGKGVVGFDIAGDEAGYSLKPHKSAFKKAYKLDIPITAHAGEAKGFLSVYETLLELKPSRIGHGIRSIEDPDLLKLLRDNRIHLEVCPSTNIQVNVFERYLSHPIDRLKKDGLSIGINTDTRTITNITLTEEYSRLNHFFGWGKRDFIESNLNAIDASFIGPKEKRLLKIELENVYSKIDDF